MNIATRRPFVLALAAVTLDALGMGLVMPVLPGLLRALVPAGQVAGHYGVLLALYALMQVCCAPMLGALSDRHGRRPVLLASLAGAATDYAIMAAAPGLWVLYVGRVVSGISGATGAVAASCIADTTADQARTRRFGLMGACYGGGLMAGPAIGGLLGSVSLHAPFAAAAALHALAFLLAWLFLPETRRPHGAAAPRAPARFVAALRPRALPAALRPLLGAYFMIQLIGQIPAVLWVVFMQDRLHWGAPALGLSLAGFGTLHALALGCLAGPLATRLGARRTLLAGMLADAAGLVLMAFVGADWLVAPILVLLAVGGVGMPALQGMLSTAAGEHGQGALQGVLASLAGLSGIVGPLLFSAVYARLPAEWNGAVWLIGAMLYALCLPALRRRPAPGRGLAPR
ncbi:Tet(A)/Tet(B)/Tet(C) family tetracycline efflux MFS transporter [Bordetella petrii]|uniref:Tet(A)/Tet(B)/Tet(C) family tetracycline efflux MFS transporter n=1 Tax=Bordetella petrii TaxID=94624 RepID=UPI0038B260C3